MIPKSLTKRSYLIITLIITLQFIYFTFNNVKITKELVENSIERDLTSIVMLLEQRLPLTYSEILAKAAGNIKEKEKISLLNEALQPIIDSISKDWPGYGMGYYSKDQKIVALTPYNSDFLGKEVSPEALKVYQQNRLVITEIQNGFTWGTGQTIIGASYPLFSKEVLIGHVWANIKTESINNSIIKAISRNIMEYFIIWVGLILVVSWSTRKINKTIAEVVNQITNDTLDVSKLSLIPQLTPVVKTVEMYEEKLKMEYIERARYQEEVFRLDRLHIVGEMAAGIGHEIRNPMTTVRGFLQLFEGKPKYQEDQENIELMINELDRANGIITEFLSLAKNRTVDFKTVNLNHILESMYPLISSNAAKLDMEIILDLGDIPCVQSDEKELKQLILNLTSNGLEAMDPGNPLYLKTYFNGKEVILEVKDTGCGIPTTILNKIGQPFFSTKDTGTGLGLSICYSICEKNKAKLDFETSSKGTTFFARFSALSVNMDLSS